MKIYASQKFVNDAIEGSKAYTDEKVAGIPVPSWDTLENKPFYENTPESITYDGNKDGKVIVEQMVKVSDKILTIEDIVGGTITLNNEGDIITIVVTEDQVTSGVGGIVFCDAIITIADINNTSDIAPETYPETGTYFMDNEGLYIQSFTAAGATIKTLDEKFIPDTIARVSDVSEQIANISVTSSWNDLTDKPFGEEGIAPITWDGVVGDRVTGTYTAGGTLPFVKVSDKVFTVDELMPASVIITMPDGSIEASKLDAMGAPFTVDGLMYFVAGSVIVISEVKENYELNGDTAVFHETGTYFMDFNAVGLTISNVTLTFPGGGIKTLDEKFIPDTIVRESDIVNELTSEETDKPLSAAQGKVLKDLIDDMKTQFETTLGASVDEIDALLGGEV